MLLWMRRESNSLRAARAASRDRSISNPLNVIWLSRCPASRRLFHCAADSSTLRRG